MEREMEQKEIAREQFDTAAHRIAQASAARRWCSASTLRMRATPIDTTCSLRGSITRRCPRI